MVGKGGALGRTLLAEAHVASLAGEATDRLAAGAWFQPLFNRVGPA